MRRNIFDIIEKTNEYMVAYYAVDYLEAISVLKANHDISYIICSSYINSFNLDKVFLAAEAGGMDVQIIVWGPLNPINSCKGKLKEHISFVGPYTKVNVFCEKFEKELITTITKLSMGLKSEDLKASKIVFEKPVEKPVEKLAENTTNVLPAKSTGKKLVALVCSTGGPRALHSVVTKLPSNLAAPVLIVQHMPKNFTKGLAERLDSDSEIKVKEAEDGERIKNGVCYIAPGGVHMEYLRKQDADTVVYSDKPAVLGLKPYGNIMYYSLCGSKYEEIVCVVLTGMGNDGCEGINKLSNHNKIYVIAQNEETSTVYGMPRAIYESGIVDVVCDIDEVAENIIKKVGVI